MPAGFPNWGRLVGGQFGQNGQKLHENDKIGIFGSKQWGGGQDNFSGSGGASPPVPPPPTRENPGLCVDLQIHQPGVPIVSFNSSPLYNLNKYIGNILEGYVKAENNNAKNSTTSNYIRNAPMEDIVTI